MATTKITSPDLFNLESLNSALKLPSGTTAQRPTSPSTGEWRYNTTTNLVEFWDGGEWRDLQSEVIPPINSENFNTVLYTGNGSTQSITGVGFKPDLVWVKVRSTTGSGPLADSSRGTGKAMYSNLTSADYTFPAGQGVTSYDADGFSIGDDSTGNGGYNGNGKTYVAWCWKANGGTTSSNTDGSITSTVQANTKAAFSVVSYTGNAVSGATIGHGLGVEPDLVIVKNLNLSTQSWNTYVKNVTTTNAQFLTLNTDAANGNTANPRFIPGNFSSSVFSVGNDNSTNGVSGVDTYIAYCFASVAGYSSIGSYTGNGSTNGPIVNTGFEPAFVMTKKTSGTSSWAMFDNKRNTSNPRINFLRANSSDAEQTDPTNYAINFFSNGFQWNGNGNDGNINGETYIYIAFAADPSTAPVLADSFANKLYTGTGSTQSITGLGFSPNYVWMKQTTFVDNHYNMDSVRGAGFRIHSNLTSEQNGPDTNRFTSFDTDGFTIGSDPSVNQSGSGFVTWNWKASLVPTINTDGTIQSIVSANQAAGFSIVKWTTNGSSGQFVGHGLSVAPSIIIYKRLDTAQDWFFNTDIIDGGYDYGNLNTTAALQGGGSAWSTQSTSTTISAFTQNNNFDYIAYCFTSISGFSDFGSYTGNGSATGPTVTTGFQPDFVMIKRTDASGYSWYIFDSARDPSNTRSKILKANSDGAEFTVSNSIDFNATSFQPKNTDPGWNANGSVYIYMAFKENPSPIVPAGYMAYLTVAGGGGGGVGYLYSNAAGGGGAGGLRTSFGSTSGGGASAESNLTLTSGTYTITIGAGGQGAYRASTPPLVRQFNGNDSSITGNASITSTAGGYGGAGGQDGGTGDYSGAIGGSGGGGSGFGSGAAGTANQGFAGASSRGGGGGASAAGSGANGGDGLSVAITGSGVAYGGGGGAGAQGSGGGGSAGTGGGGAGSQNSGGVTKDGTANTGGGGGGGRGGSGASGSGTGWYGGGAGGSGVVILRMRTTDYSGTTTGSPTITTRGEETILTYTGSGTYVHS